MMSTPGGIVQSSPCCDKHSWEESLLFRPYGRETEGWQQPFRSQEDCPGLVACSSRWEGLSSSSILVWTSFAHPLDFSHSSAGRAAKIVKGNVHFKFWVWQIDDGSLHMLICVRYLGHKYLPWPPVFSVFANLCSSCSPLSTGGKMEVSHKHNNGENDSTNFCNVWIHSSSHHSPEASKQHRYPQFNNIEQITWNDLHLKQTTNQFSLPECSE